MGILIIFSIIAILGLIHSCINNNKFTRWLFPIISFLFSMYIIGFMVIYELTHYINKGKNFWDIFDANRIWGMIIIFAILNIPTLIFTIINKYKGKNKRENKLNNCC